MASKFASANPIAEYLEQHEQCTGDAARHAGERIAAAWNDREFWMDRTLRPITDCLRQSNSTADPRAVVARVARQFGAWVHDVPAPPGAPLR
uniref:hypothetical protein n=1 Tax=Amycolatopsis sp. CA-290885 TaxID=3239925 RepID=UPI003F491388